MRRAARVDDNHRDIINSLEEMHCTVLDLSKVGGGCPDILVGWQGINILFEIKDGNKPPSRRRLRDNQESFMQRWKGPAYAVNSFEEAWAIISQNCYRRLNKID